MKRIFAKRLSGLPFLVTIIVVALLSALPAGAADAADDMIVRQDRDITVNGIVRDSQQEPMIGVAVVIKGTSEGTLTDENGQYFIEVPDGNAVLEFSCLGFETAEVKVGTQININVNLHEKSDNLNEVVVVAYGNQKKVSVVGSITSVNPEILQQGSTRAVSNNLAGQLAGVIAVQRSGEPGRDNSEFWIRGISSFQSTGRDPLVLVDGIERTLDDLSAAEIESFTVLKDAAASAVYGVRGANGVILVQTKRGQLGKPKVNFHVEQGFTSPVKLPQYINSSAYLSLMNELYLDAGNQNLLYTQAYIDNFRNGTDPELYPSVDWVDAISKNAANNTRGDITITGGSDILRYAFVASYYREGGIMESDPAMSWKGGIRLNKYNIRSNVDINVTKTTVVGISVGGYLQETNTIPVSVDEIWNEAFETPPFVHPTQYSGGRNVRVTNRINPWAEVTQTGYSKGSSSKIESLFSVEQDLKFITEGLKIKALFSFDRFANSWVDRTRTPTYYQPTTTRDTAGNLMLTVGTDGQEFLDTSPGTEWGNKAVYFEANLFYDRSFGKHSIAGMFLYNQRDYNDGSVVPYRRMGIAGRASYTYANRYIAEFNFGYNGSENFAKGHRFGFFPSVALGYVISEEPFMAGVKNIFSMLKLRGSWGLTGNDQLAGRRFAFLSTIDTDGYYNWGVDNDNSYSSRFEGEYGVEDLTWETVEKLNIGIDLGLFNQVNLQVDWFREQRRDIFMQRENIPTAAGFRYTPWENYGKVDNTGVELSLSWMRNFSKDFYVGFRGTFTYAHNTIIEQDEAPGVKGTNRQKTGRSVGELFGLDAIGLFTYDDFVTGPDGNLVLKDGIPEQAFSTNLRPGDIRYRDVNGDGVVNSMDEIAMGGTVNPEIVYGFGLTLRYKAIDFNVFFQGNGKTYRFLGGPDSSFLPGSTMGVTGNIFSNYNDRWTVDNQNQDVFYPRLTYGQNSNNSQNSTWWLRDMSMLRMKEIEVGWSLPERWISKARIEGVRLYLKGSNLLTFSKFNLWDPELDTSTGSKYPIMKAVSIGLDINF